MNALQAIFLGAIQGLTEFLPVSSSGHLSLFQIIFGLNAHEDMLLFDVVLHLGTLCPVVIVFRREIMDIFAGIFSGSRPSPGADLAMHDRWQMRYLALSIIVGTIPAGIAGYLFKDSFERLFGSAAGVSLALLTTGTFLFALKWAPRERKGLGQIGFWDSLIIGLAQAAAITPGISRSGSTICMAMFLGVERSAAARFSFLLSIPAILGAVVLQLKDLDGAAGVSIQTLAIGFVSSFAVGLAALGILLRLVKQGRLTVFAYYCWAIGAIGLIYSLIK